MPRSKRRKGADAREADAVLEEAAKKSTVLLDAMQSPRNMTMRWWMHETLVRHACAVPRLAASGGRRSSSSTKMRC